MAPLLTVVCKPGHQLPPIVTLYRGALSSICFFLPCLHCSLDTLELMGQSCAATQRIIDSTLTLEKVRWR